MTQELAKELKQTFNVDCGYYSVLNSDDIDGLPFYCSQDYDNYEVRLMNILKQLCLTAPTQKWRFSGSIPRRRILLSKFVLDRL
jgi:hypothetical protein